MAGPTAFDDFEAIASEAVEGMYGEAIRIEPKAREKWVGGLPDTNRTAFNTRGIVDMHPDINRVRSSGRTDGDAPDATGGSSHVVIRHAAMAGAGRFTPKQGDIIIATGRTPSLEFHIIHPQDDGVGAVTFVCMLK